MRNRTLALLAVSLVAVVAAVGVAIFTAPTASAEARRNPQAAAARRNAPRTPTPAPTAVFPTPTTAAPAASTTTATTAPSNTPVATATSTAPAPTPTNTPAPVPTIAQAPAIGFTDDFEALTAGIAWADGASQGNWYSRFNGYGTVAAEVDGDKVLSLSPKPSTSSGETHAALVVSNTRFTDVDFTVQVKTVTQLRTPTPNAWESGWVLWHFTDDTHFYYVALKPNGIEVGKEDPAYPGAQRFLVTLSNPTFAVGRWYNVRVKQVGATFNIWVDGTLVTTFTDSERPYTGGAVGLYTEDADVHFNNARAYQP